MKRWLATILVFAVCSAVVRADVTIVQTTTMEGGMAAMGGANMSPKMTNRIKGMKSRSDVDLPNVNASTIIDLVTKQVVVLRHDQKTAQILGAAAPVAPATTTVTVDASVTPTGKSQVIDGIKCDQYTFATTMSMAEMSAPQMPPAAAEILNDLTTLMQTPLSAPKYLPSPA